MRELADRTTKGPEQFGAELTAHLESLAAKHGAALDDGSAWWTHEGSAGVRVAIRWFPGLTYDAVKRDPLTADQACREYRMCRECDEGKPDGKGGVRKCPLGKAPWEGDVLHPGRSARHYLIYEHIYDESGPRYQWSKRECRSKERRAQEIAEREGRMRDIGGGMRGVEVER